MMATQWQNSRREDHRPCTGVFSRVTGLLCSHDLQRAQTTGALPVPDDIHPHWLLREASLPVTPQLPSQSPSHSPSPALGRQLQPTEGQNPALEHASGPVVDPQLLALNALDNVRDPEVIPGWRSQRGGRQPESSTRRDPSLFEVVEGAVEARNRQERARGQRGRARGQGRGRGGAQGPRGGHGRAQGPRGGRGRAQDQRGAHGQTQQPEDLQEQLAPDQEQLQMTLSQFAGFAPVANRLSEMRTRGQRGPRAQAAPTYRGVPEGLVGSFQLASQ